MSDGEFDDEAYRAYEDELYKDDESVVSDNDVDSETEEALYGSVHYALSLEISPEDNTPEKTSDCLEGMTQSDSEHQRESTAPPVIVVDSSSDSSEESDDNSVPERPEASENWDLDSKDLAVNTEGKKIKSRYYKPMDNRTGKRCHNCKERGHFSSDCQKVSSCYLCGTSGHRSFRCPKQLCFNCHEPGHQSRNCRKPRKRYNIECRRCFQTGHQNSDCPDRWRQYHLTTKAGRVVTPQKTEEKPQDTVYCYNCAQQGHYGHECTEERMAGSSAVLPFIVQYDGCPRPAHRASHRHNNDQKRHSWPQTHKNQKQDKHMNRKHWHPDTSHGWGPHNNYRGERHRQQHQTPRSQVPLDGLHTVGSRQANSDRLVGDGYPSPRWGRKRIHQGEQDGSHTDIEPQRKKKKSKKQKGDYQAEQRTVEVLEKSLHSPYGYEQSVNEGPPVGRINKRKKRRGHQSPGRPDFSPSKGRQFVSERGFVCNRLNNKHFTQ